MPCWFEFGYSVADPLTLVLWEAQFGGLANGAQILTSGGFREVLWDRPPGLSITRVVFCSSMIYYYLLAACEARQANHVALVRIEQLYPFAERRRQRYAAALPLTAETVWAQDEPRNTGAWRFMQEQLQPLLASTGRELRYVGPPESASPATGSGRRHQEEQAAIYYG